MLIDRFPQFFPPSRDELEEIFRTGLLVLDSSILLDLYKFTGTAREECFATLRKLKGRVWVPHQVALEYHHNRLRTIRDAEENLAHVQHAWETLKGKVKVISGERSFPVDASRLQNHLRDLKNEIASLNEEVKNIARNDLVLKELETVLEIGPDPDASLVNRVKTEGASRYSKKIPPGWGDEVEKANLPPYQWRDLSLERKFGDLYLWEQMIEACTQRKADSTSFGGVLFVTNDLKPDWWKRDEKNKQVVCPLPELVEEFCRRTSCGPFWMYTMDQFVIHGGEVLNVNTDTAAEEAKRMEHPVNHLVPFNPFYVQENLFASNPTYFLGANPRLSEIPNDLLQRLQYQAGMLNAHWPEHYRNETLLEISSLEEGLKRLLAYDVPLQLKSDVSNLCQDSWRIRSELVGAKDDFRKAFHLSHMGAVLDRIEEILRWLSGATDR